MPENSIIFVGPVPPPVTGYSIINEKMSNKISSYGLNVTKLDTSPGTIERNLGYIFRKVKSIIRISIFLIRYKSNNKTKLYCSVSGKKGKIFEIIFVTISRIKKMKIYLHHHSFLYINNNQFLANLLFKISGENCIHITLSKNMAKQLKEKYNSINHISHISNICFINNNMTIKKEISKTLKNIGFLSNISFEKGIDVFFTLIAELQDKEFNITASIAGPFHDNNVKEYVLSQISNSESIKYWGPVYGKRKEEFFNNIDLLVLPSQNEAEPLVIYESMMNGIPVIAHEVGCIHEQIGKDEMSGKIIPLNKPFVENALSWIKIKTNSTSSYQRSIRATINRYELLKRNTEIEFEKLLSNIFS